MKRKYLIFIILINTVVIMYSQSVWTGNAAVAGEKEFESYYSDDSETGRFLGASNSFPGSTEVTVTNPRNGKSVSVSIVKRLSQPGVFLVLSAEAGDAIELPDDDILNVEVAVTRKNEEVFSNYSDDLPYSADPDLNPSAELTESASEEDSPIESAAAEITAGLAEPAPEVEPPVEADVSEFIPPVVIDEESISFDEGYDPLVTLGEEEDIAESGEIMEIIDDPQVLAESITGTVSEPDVPLPETYSETDLPETYTPESPEDAVGEAVTMAEPDAEEGDIVLPEPAALETEESDPLLMDAEIDDLLIPEAVVEEPVTDELEMVEVADPEIEEKLITVLSEPVVSEPVATVVEEPEISETVVTDVEDAVIIEPIVPETEERDILDASVSEPIVLVPDIPAAEEPAVEEPAVEEPAVEEPAVEEVVVSESDIEVAETEIPPENVIYFLTPGDFRPPLPSEDKKEKVKDKPKEKIIVALPVERAELEGIIVRELKNGGSYLQLGTYSSVDVLYSRIEQISDSYPSIVLTMGDGDEQLYKLLIGPISRDEKGVVITRFRSQGYDDAFLYRP